MREEFLSVASHELRTPLTPLQLQLQVLAWQTQTLARDEAAAEQLAARVATLQRQSERLVRLVDALFDVAEHMDRPLELQLEPVDLGEVVRTVAAQLVCAGQVERADCTLHVRIDEPTVGCWDRRRVEDIVRQLLDNALKFGSGAEVEVAVTRDPDGGAATLTVTDHGIGIAAEDHARIFERFERAVSTRHYGGFGLGLFIARQAAEALGGSVSVDSQPGQGATFQVHLPLTQRS